MRTRLLTWTGLLLAAIVVLHGAGAGPLDPPALHSATDWRIWLAGHDPVVAAFALARLAALVAAWYLLAVTVAGLVLRLLRAGRLTAALDRVTVRPVRALLATAMGLSLVTAGVGCRVAGVGTRAAAAQTAPPGSEPPATVTMHRLPEAAPASPAPTPAPPSPADAATGRWDVRPGQCFWSIAEDVLTRARGRPPSDPEIVAYWHRLIEANRTALADPANPDLVFPGQTFAIPLPDGGGPGLAVTK